MPTITKAITTPDALRTGFAILLAKPSLYLLIIIPIVIGIIILINNHKFDQYHEYFYFTQVFDNLCYSAVPVFVSVLCAFSTNAGLGAVVEIAKRKSQVVGHNDPSERNA